jgi:hypothetical protein
MRDIKIIAATSNRNVLGLIGELLLTILAPWF